MKFIPKDHHIIPIKDKQALHRYIISLQFMIKNDLIIWQSYN